MIKPDPDSCHLLLDSRLANEEVQKNPYTYNNIREVLSDGALNAATVEHPVTVYIAPGIYWLEDPQSEAVIVREDPKDLYPYGCKVNCANLKLVGLSENPEVADSHTVDIDEKMLAEAYYIRKDGETIYNVYNLLGGKDDWDPLGNGEVIRFAGKTDIPTQLLLESEAFELEAGGSSINIKGKCLTFDGRERKCEIHFKIEGDSADSIEIQRVSERSCLLQLKDSNIDHETEVVLTAQTKEGLQTGAYVRLLLKHQSAGFLKV